MRTRQEPCPHFSSYKYLLMSRFRSIFCLTMHYIVMAKALLILPPRQSLHRSTCLRRDIRHTSACLDAMHLIHQKLMRLFRQLEIAGNEVDNDTKYNRHNDGHEENTIDRTGRLSAGTFFKAECRQTDTEQKALHSGCHLGQQAVDTSEDAFTALHGNRFIDISHKGELEYRNVVCTGLADIVDDG